MKQGLDIRGTALRMLARRALTRRELTARLKRKGFSAGAVRDAVQEIVAEGYIDEIGIAEDAVRHGRDERLVGRFLIRYELVSRGIREDVVEKILDRDYPAEVEADKARLFAERKVNSLKGLKPDKSAVVRRVAGALERRGFRGDVIGEVIGFIHGAMDVG